MLRNCNLRVLFSIISVSLACGGTLNLGVKTDDKHVNKGNKNQNQFVDHHLRFLKKGKGKSNGTKSPSQPSKGKNKGGKGKIVKSAKTTFSPTISGMPSFPPSSFPSASPSDEVCGTMLIMNILASFRF